jgi:hypothetical protein
MTTLKIRLEKNLNGEKANAAIYTEISGPGIRGSKKILVPVNDQPEDQAFPPQNYFAFVELAQEGTFLVTAVFPSGEIACQDIAVKAGETKSVNLKMPTHTRHEWLRWQHLIEGINDKQSFDLPLEDTEGLRFWRFCQANRSLVPEPEEPQFDVRSVRDATFIKYNIENYDRYVDAAYFAEIRAQGETWIIALPSPFFAVDSGNAFRTEVMVARVPDSDIAQRSVESKIRISVIVPDEKTGPMFAYLCVGDMKALDLASYTMAAEAENMLYHKVKNPFVAALGGYILLKMRKLNQLHSWPENLTNWFPWLPDGAIIYGRQLLAMGKVEQARSAFLEAERRGIPVFCHGVRNLIAGLSHFSHNRSDNSEEADTGTDVDRALYRLRMLSMSIDWDQTITVFKANPAERSPVNMDFQPL